MRMCLESASRQPCSAGSCIAVTRNLLSGLKVTARCEPAHSRNSGRRRHVGKPQGHAVVMRDRKPQALWRERQPADGRGHLERFLLVLAAADKGGLAGRPREGAIGMQRDIVDPAPLCVGREQRDLALGVERNELAVIAAHDEARPVGSRAEDAAAMDGDRRHFALPADQEDVFLGADKGRVLAEEMHGRDGRADRDRAHPVGDRCDGGGVLARIELCHHVVIQRSKPSRMLCSGNSRPMKTRRLSRGSPSFQARW